jgi:hypothetical protein
MQIILVGANPPAAIAGLSHVPGRIRRHPASDTAQEDTAAFALPDLAAAIAREQLPALHAPRNSWSAL